MSLKEPWQVVREDDNAVIYLVKSNLPKQEAISLAKEFNDANAAKPHPHKQSWWAEPKQPRMC